LHERWKKSRPNRAARVWIGTDASEARLKREVAGTQLLHLATHGFFLGESCAASPLAAEDTGMDDGTLRIRGEIALTNPLLLSGLALAGANPRRDPFVAEDDGILTAEEIASLQLRGSELVVLSACDTGLGSVLEGEGVFGLRRALAVAGARNLVMSLWAVEDRSARELMESFYDAYLGRNESADGSLRSAQLVLIERRRKQGQSTHPYYWAGFVATELGRSANSPNSD
jgi:CHAT domain-containing protein